MAIVARKPRNASLRFQTFIDTSTFIKKKPLKRLTIGLVKLVEEMLMVELLFVIVVAAQIENIE